MADILYFVGIAAYVVALTTLAVWVLGDKLRPSAAKALGVGGWVGLAVIYILIVRIVRNPVRHAVLLGVAAIIMGAFLYLVKPSSHEEGDADAGSGPEDENP